MAPTARHHDIGLRRVERSLNRRHDLCIGHLFHRAILEQGPPEEIFGAPKSARLGEFLANVGSLQSPGTPRVAPGNAANSYLIRKLEGTNTVGSRMPLGGPFLDADTIARIKSWIASGAPDN